MEYLKYGHFDDKSESFHITEPDIPRNWYNYLWNENYITYISQTGAGESFLQDRLGKRISLVRDRGAFICENGKSLGICGLPVKEKRDSYRCIHRRGETTVYTERDGIRSELCVFVPRSEACEIWTLNVKNLSGRTRDISALLFFGSDFDSAYTRQGYNTEVASFDSELNGVIISKNSKFNGCNGQAWGFMAMSAPVDGYDCTYNSIVGPYGSFAHPVIAERGFCTSTDGCGEKLGYALEKKMCLAPGEENQIAVICGIAFSMEEAVAIKSKYSDMDKVLEEKCAVLSEFAKDTKQVEIFTPDEELNKMFSWLKHQTNMGARWARVRHNGFRDLTSDTDCLAVFNPQKALDRFLRILTYQYSNGYAPRTFIKGAIEDKNFSDNTVWLNFTASSILKELGRKDILDIEVPYNDGSVGTVYEHLYRSVDFLYKFRGLHGLIRIWGGDWNDCMNRAGLEGKGVSVWLSIAWYRACKVFAEIAEIYGRPEDRDEALCRCDEMREIIEEHGWDGEYYLDAYNDDDKKIGSHECEEGKIFLIPQLWSVLSGVSDRGRELVAMDSVEKYLSSPLGTRVSTPAYTKYDAGIGTVTKKPAGVHENGGVYLHTVAWKVAVDALLKRAHKVEEDIETILPFRNKVVAGRAEPYIMCNSYFGSETGYRYGTPGQSWRTAAGQWFQKALVNYVFGLMPEMEGLRIDPCLPPSWKACGINKTFRGCTYNIRYENGGVRVKSIIVDGKEIDGNILPLKTGQVEVLVVTE